MGPKKVIQSNKVIYIYHLKAFFEEMLNLILVLHNTVWVRPKKVIQPNRMIYISFEGIFQGDSESDISIT